VDGSPYVVRYCAYIDILGFRELVRQIGEDELKLGEVANILSRVHQPRLANAFNPNAVQYRTQSISDAVAISVAPTVEGLHELFSSLHDLTMELLTEGYLLRGAIVKGRLYHDDKMVFGDALVKAYELEMQIVRFPRVMITREVALDLNVDNALAQTCQTFMRQADDGPVHLHPMRRMLLEFNNAPMKPDDVEDDRFGEYHRIKQMLERRLYTAMDNPRHFEKVQWFARYWNKHLPDGAASFRVKGPGLD
jgi:hypothetical protein